MAKKFLILTIKMKKGQFLDQKWLLAHFVMQDKKSSIFTTPKIEKKMDQ